MIDELIKLMTDQEKDLKLLLDLLEIQNEMILKKDLFGLEGLVDKLNECSKRIAKQEVQRRKLLGKSSISETVEKSNNNDLKQSYKNIRSTLNSDINNAKKVSDIKNKVESSTYNVDAKLTAKSLLNVMKEENS